VDGEGYLERLAHYREKFDFRLLTFFLKKGKGQPCTSCIIEVPVGTTLWASSGLLR